MRRPWGPLFFALMLLIGTLPAAAGPAINQFEVKDLEVEQGEVEIEDQSDWAFGLPRRKFFVDGGGPEFDDNEVARQRHSIEIGFGLTNWLKIGTGFELEEERVDDPEPGVSPNKFDSLKVTEIQFEGLVVLVPVKTHGIGLGAYVELQLPTSDEARTLYVGPIIQAVSGPWSATGNFAFVKFLGGTPEEGEAKDEKWDFAYFTQLKYEASEAWAFALEAYGTIDRIGNSGTPSEAAVAIGDQDQHRIGPVLYYTFKRDRMAPVTAMKLGAVSEGDDDDEGTSATLGLGFLAGLNDNTPDGTLKLGLEIEF
ncbi:MAG: hypothetical protein V3R26_04485 [Hyphomicrobium sp.]